MKHGAYLNAAKRTHAEMRDRYRRRGERLARAMLTELGLADSPMAKAVARDLGRLEALAFRLETWFGSRGYFTRDGQIKPAVSKYLDVIGDKLGSYRRLLEVLCQNAVGAAPVGDVEYVVCFEDGTPIDATTTDGEASTDARADAVSALMNLDYPEDLSVRSVDAAIDRLGDDANLEAVISRALALAANTKDTPPNIRPGSVFVSRRLQDGRSGPDDGSVAETVDRPTSPGSRREAACDGSDTTAAEEDDDDDVYERDTNHAGAYAPPTRPRRLKPNPVSDAIPNQKPGRGEEPVRFPGSGWPGDPR
jgi:hypothetical protein